jgi:transglutaminase/protease-like cytokinesis protein 3
MRIATKNGFRAVVLGLILALAVTSAVPFTSQAYAATKSKDVAKSITVREYNPAPKGKEWDVERRLFGESKVVKLSPKFKKGRYVYNTNFKSRYKRYLFFDKLKVKVKIEADKNAKIYVKTKAKGKWKKKGSSYSHMLKFDWGETQTVWFRVGKGKTYKVTLHRWFADNKKVEKKVKAVAKQIIKPEMSEAEIVVAVVKWIQGNIRYDYDFDPTNSDPYLGLLEGYGVCMQFNAAFQAFMRHYNIPVGSAGRPNHVWSVVKVDDAWYHVDSTVGLGSTLIKDPVSMSSPPTGYWYNGKHFDKNIKCPNDHPDRDKLAGSADGDTSA